MGRHFSKRQARQTQKAQYNFAKSRRKSGWWDGKRQ